MMMSLRKKRSHRSMKKSKAMKRMRMMRMMGGSYGKQGPLGHSLRRSESGYGPATVNLKRNVKAVPREVLYDLVAEDTLNRKNALRYPRESPSFHRALTEEQLLRDEKYYKNLFNRYGDKEVV